MRSSGNSFRTISTSQANRPAQCIVAAVLRRMYSRCAKGVRASGLRGKGLKQLFSSFAGAVENLDAIIHLEINRCEPGYPVKLPAVTPLTTPRSVAANPTVPSAASLVMATGS